jgi:glycerol kinase
MLMDINSLEWSEKMLSEFEIEKKWLPEIKKSSSDHFGNVNAVKALEGVPIGGVLGDQQAACLGHFLAPGEVKNTYGTGCFMLANTGEKPVQSKHGLLTTLCYRLGDKTNYALEGAVEVAGAAI